MVFRVLLTDFSGVLDQPIDVVRHVLAYHWISMFLDGSNFFDWNWSGYRAGCVVTLYFFNSNRSINQ